MTGDGLRDFVNQKLLASHLYEAKIKNMGNAVLLQFCRSNEQASF
jgi:hypothetical protein